MVLPSAFCASLFDILRFQFPACRFLVMECTDLHFRRIHVPMITPSTVTRRQLRFATIEDLLHEIEQIVAADREGRLQTLGSWTPGQILGHVAAWIEYGYDGYPMQPPPWFIRVLRAGR